MAFVCSRPPLCSRATYVGYVGRMYELVKLLAIIHFVGVHRHLADQAEDKSEGDGREFHFSEWIPLYIVTESFDLILSAILFCQRWRLANHART